MPETQRALVVTASTESRSSDRPAATVWREPMREGYVDIEGVGGVDAGTAFIEGWGGD